jgi:hypothetical protein
MPSRANSVTRNKPITLRNKKGGCCYVTSPFSIGVTSNKPPEPARLSRIACFLRGNETLERSEAPVHGVAERRAMAGGGG